MARDYSYKHQQKQVQKQVQKFSQKQIQAVSFLHMTTRDLRNEILKAVNENPALEIVEGKNKNTEGQASSDFLRTSTSSSSYISDKNKEAALENAEDQRESLQSHLMHQLNSMQLSQDEIILSEKLIYNLDKEGCWLYAPETLLDTARPAQNKKMLASCIDRIQKMDPVGTCCKNLEESLLIQARISDDPPAPPLALFILDGHLDMLNPPDSEIILEKLVDFQKAWHKKSFAGKLILDEIRLDERAVEKSLRFIRSLNPRPAQGFTYDTNNEFIKPDIILSVEKIPGPILSDDFSLGLVSGNANFHFQIKYASGLLPQLQISKDFKIDSENYNKAKDFIQNLQYRENTIVLQGCGIVSAQKDFFLKGPGFLQPFTRRQLAKVLDINESTVSRLSGKKGSKYIQTEWGLFPASYFFTSKVSGKGGEVSSDSVKNTIKQILKESGNLSDSKLTEILNEEGIKIARRTVSKYRNQLGIENSYKR